ncbi:MAG: hexosaminidase [Phycisphaerales bacterium]
MPESDTPTTNDGREREDLSGSTPLSKRPPLLIPRPRRIECDLAALVEIHRISPVGVDDGQVPPGGYRLSIDADGVRIASADDAGARAGQATLSQLRTQYPDALPHLRIEDHPALPNRGVMLDVSRTRVPSNAELRRSVEQFAGLKLNHLQLYTEHAFAYTGVDAAQAVWGGTDPITPDEIRELDAHARSNGVELAANQNCFGHLARWLKHDAFVHLAETQSDWSFLGMPRTGPFSLCPTDTRSIGFVEGLLDELLPCFESSLVNIGCDETYDVGQGRSAGAVAARGKGEVYGRFVAQICDSVLARNHRPMMWGDIAHEHPEVVGMLPRQTIGLVWGYEPSSDFASMGRVWHEAGCAWWVCPGTSSWRSYTGRSAERRANIRRAAREGVDGGAQGLLVTDWGDVGHPQAWPVALMGIAEAADAAWTGEERHADFLDAVSLQVFGDRSLRTARWLESLGDADKPLRDLSGVRTDPGTPARGTPAPLANSTAMFTELHTPPMPLHLPDAVELWAQARQRVSALLESVPNGAGQLVEAECEHAARCALFACDVAVFRRGGGGAIAVLADRMDERIAEHRRLWLIRSRLGGLDESVAFWESIEIEKPSED